MKFPLIISYYTRNTYYQLEVQNLIETCEKFNLAYDIEAIDSYGTWELNCAYKPFFIHRKLLQHKQPLFWLDADAIFVQSPTHQFSSDLSARINDVPPTHPSRILSGSLYAAYTATALASLHQWATECQRQINDPNRTVEFWDQTALHNLPIDPLPHTYCKISGHPLDEINILDPVIIHNQASRRFKKFI